MLGLTDDQGVSAQGPTPCNAVVIHRTPQPKEIGWKRRDFTSKRRILMKLFEQQLTRFLKF
jgi:hypothetical protein